jgi:hypothetical protein
VRGLLAPLQDDYAVGFNPVHGFDSGTDTYEVGEDADGRPPIILYVGDFDPSGMFMSEVDLLKRFAKYKGHHIKLKHIALTPGRHVAYRHSEGIPYKWFVANHGKRC